jgi:hypothetical protein
MKRKRAIVYWDWPSIQYQNAEAEDTQDSVKEATA